ncbi:ParA-like protein [Hartmannibacter diazotrophicus]|uniref:ParA-like protein n=1 Tax=Hartmannibacter diazotrophicus TaxID=1482074 RepID=A0A2C9DCH2_9HYPH|nr:AAA family ATPase [Hartmannibacter diazotrophicus]SON57305.1 ParA-like protein [Hartmannibacter diazotrophicus]
MKSIAFFNNKGGVGKTTLLCNVAAYAALKLNKKVCVVDADPQCNATQYFFDYDTLDELYTSQGGTIYSVVEPLTEGEGFSDEIPLRKCISFGIDVLPGDPNLALTEDFLAQDWGAAKSGDIRGIKTNLFFSELLGRLEKYDYVFIDVSPSLGAINRSILLASDYFVSPMSIDIFSLKAFENIAAWIEDWESDWAKGIANVRDKKKIPDLSYGQAVFLGYVTQQYLAKRDASGVRRGVKAYESIRAKIDGVIKRCGLDKGIAGQTFEIGTVPNLFSLIPMSQSSNKPVFELRAGDGVVGAHFVKVRDAEKIFELVSKSILGRAHG